MMADTVTSRPSTKDGKTPPTDCATVVVLGLGVTGLSCARYLSDHGARVLVADSRQDPPGLEGLRSAAPEALVETGTLDVRLPDQAELLVVSPGLPLDLPVIRQARQRGIEVVGDIELFARAVRCPVAAITGSNGKSTVTTMVAEMAARSGRQMPAGANLGTPALDLLEMPAEGYLLELSSFQLELTETLRPRVAAVLNLSADHIDRHGSMEAYAAAKARILRHAESAVINRDDPLVMEMASDCATVASFGSDAPARETDYGIRETGGRGWLARGRERLMPANEIGVPGRHNALNALAALAIAEKMGLGGDAVLAALRSYRGLPHRTQVVAERRGVRWIDDSKATNVGAAVAAIRGMEMPLVLIAGGDGKGAGFAPLVDALQGRARAVVLLGRDAPRLAEAIGDTVPWNIVDSMSAAVETARRLARPGDAVLLSPACASLDMFSSFAARGMAFQRAVLEGEE